MKFNNFCSTLLCATFDVIKPPRVLFSPTKHEMMRPLALFCAHTTTLQKDDCSMLEYDLSLLATELVSLSSCAAMHNILHMTSQHIDWCICCARIVFCVGIEQTVKNGVQQQQHRAEQSICKVLSFTATTLSNSIPR